MQKDAGKYNIKRQNMPDKESIYKQSYRKKRQREGSMDTCTYRHFIESGTVSAEGVIKMRLRLGEREESHRGSKGVPDRETKRVVCLSEC